MKLYHGTSYQYLDLILHKGIRPRSLTKGNWEKNPSRCDMSYLTSIYPFYFAGCACNGENIGLVFEIDVDKLNRRNIYPDEDFLQQALKIDNKAARQQVEAYRSMWEASLLNIGTCCYKGIIPVKAITRYSVINFKLRPQIWLTIMDASISHMNLKLKGGFYQQLVEWVFGDRKELPMVHDAQTTRNMFTAALTGSVDTQTKKVLEGLTLSPLFWEAQSKNKDGITVVYLKC